MAYGNKDMEYEAGAPKKADVLIRSTQHIAMKQDELSEQTQKLAERLDEIFGQFEKGSQDSAYIAKQNGEIFSQLQSENSALKQELLYLAKQSENIYGGLAEKINELTEQAKTREDSLNALTDKINDVSEFTQKSGQTYSDIVDKLTELAEQNKRTERLFSQLSDKLEYLSESSRRSERAYGELSDKMVVSEKSEPVEIGNIQQLMDKLNYISDQMRRNEGAHSMLADKFEILSMRVEQFGFESAKGASAYNRAQPQVAPVVYPAAVQTEVKAEIDYEKLAQKVADIISTREVISPEYIASKVAEQVVIPEVQTADVRVSVDTQDIAKQVADLIGNQVVRVEAAPASVSANVSIDEEGLADRIAQKLGGIRAEEIAPASAVADIDEEELAERIAKKVGSFRPASVAPVSANVSIDEDELADSIALKVGSLKAEDFEILVDDEGCTSISKEIADNLDYNTISNIIADKLREALDLASVNAPDYEEMAERISEKITVAGINEAAIADKAAAALSNYLPEIDTDEIADKVTGAVIDVVSAIPQPTVDTETICNTISERLIQSQEDHDYDIVIDDEGISKITGIVNEEIERETAARFDKVEEDIAKICELLEKTEEEQPAVVEEPVAEEEVVEKAEEVEETEEVEEKTVQVAVEPDYDKFTEIVATEIEKGTASRFDKVEDEIAKLTELVSSITVEEDEAYAEEEYEEYAEEDYTALSEVVASEIEKGVASRLSGIEENVAKITEYLTAEEEVEEETDEQYEEEYEGEEEAVEDYTALSEIVAAEIEKGIEDVAIRISGIEENVAKITEYLASEEVEEEEETEDGQYEAETEETEEVVEDYTALSEVVATEIEKGIEGVNTRLTGVEENITKVEESIAKISEYITAERYEAAKVVNPTAQETAEVKQDAMEYVEIDDSAILSEIVATEIEKGVASRLSSVEENITRVEAGIAKITEYITAEEDEEADAQVEEVDDYATLSQIVATEIERGISFRLDGVEENIVKLTELVEAQPEVQAVETDYDRISEVVAEGIKNRFDKVDEDIAKLTEIVESGNEAQPEVQAVETDYDRISEVVAEGIKNRFDKVDEDIAKLTEIVENGTESNDGERLDKVEENIAKLCVLVENNNENKDDERLDKVQDDVAQIKEMLSNGVIAVSEVAAAVAPAVEEVAEEEEELVKVSDLVEPEEDEEVEVESAVETSPEPVVDTEVETVAVEHTVDPIREKETIRESREYIKEKETLIILGNNQYAEPSAEPAKQPIDIDDNFEEFEEDEEEEDDDDDFSIDVLDMDAFADDELMPGELSDYADGVDFANMMKFKRSFIARIIQSNDEYTRYYGEVKHALLSYKKVNSNIAWGAERFNKGRETIARMKIRGKTLCLYLALDPNNYKTSVYHHLDVSDNKSVEGTPMMVKVKSNLGVRKAIRLIDEMLAMRNGEKKEIPERDYAAMYPYETIEELIEEGLVKDVRKK